MKRVAYLSAVLSLLVFSGCTTTQPTIDATANTSSNGSMNQMPSTSSNTNTAVIAPITNASPVDSSTNANGDAANGAKGITSIYFDYDKFDIRDDMHDPLKTNGALSKNKTLKLEGNCDEFGSDEYNFALGLKRANAVKAALIDQGLSADSISMTSLGEGNPACAEKTQECWAKNRRVDFKLQ